MASPVAAYEVEPALADVEADRFDIHDDLLRMGHLGVDTISDIIPTEDVTEPLPTAA
jgi:hypothetical protein